MYAVLASNCITGTHTPTPADSNWILVGDAQSSTTNSAVAHLYVWKKKVLAAEAGTNGVSSYTFSITEGLSRAWNITIVALDAMDVSESFEEIAFDGDGGTVSATVPTPSVTTDAADRIVVRIGAIREASTTFSQASGYTERFDVANASGTLFTVTWQDKIQAAAGATGAQNLVAGGVGATGQHIGATLVLIPEAAPADPGITDQLTVGMARW